MRSFATAEDTASTSFAGMNETFTNVRGEEELRAWIVDCWTSLVAKDGPALLDTRIGAETFRVIRWD